MHALQFGDGSFDVAFDKGGLDALMGDEGEGADTAGVPHRCCVLRPSLIAVSGESGSVAPPFRLRRIV